MIFRRKFWVGKLNLVFISIFMIFKGIGLMIFSLKIWKEKGKILRIEFYGSFIFICRVGGVREIS